MRQSQVSPQAQSDRGTPVLQLGLLVWHFLWPPARPITREGSPQISWDPHLSCPYGEWVGSGHSPVRGSFSGQGPSCQALCTLPQRGVGSFSSK